MSADNLLFQRVAAAGTFTLPEGFLFASIYPAEGSTYTITNSLAEDISGVSTKISPAFDTIFSIPNPGGSSSWAAHIITAIGGNVDIVYATGR